MEIFDTRDNGGILRDDEGFNLPDLEATKVQGAKSLAGLALDVLPNGIRRCVAVEARDRCGKLVLTTELTFEVKFLVEPVG